MSERIEITLSRSVEDDCIRLVNEEGKIVVFYGDSDEFYAACDPEELYRAVCTLKPYCDKWAKENKK